MHPPMFLCMLLLTTYADAGFADDTIYKPVGSSFTFPPVNITNGTLYDLRRENGNLVFTYHLTGSVRPPYNERAEFFSRNGTLILRNLTKDDNATYEQEVNMKVVDRIHLYVIEPVKEPTLRKVSGSQCRVLLECCVQESNPLNVTFLKDGKEITGNITREDQFRYLCINASDLGCSGTYSCKSSNPLGAKTSSEIELLTSDHNDCKETTSNLPDWTIVLFIIFFIIIIIILVVFSIVCCKRQKKRPKEESGDEESGDRTSQDTSQLEKPLLNESSPKEERRRGSYPNSPATNSEEPGENLDDDPGLPTEVDASENPGQVIVGKNDPGHCGQEESSAMELEEFGSASDHGPLANG